MATEERIHPAIVLAAVRAIAGIDPAAAPALPDPAEPVPRSRKLAILDRLLQLGGTGAILGASRHLKETAEDPLLAVLLNADSVGVLLDKLAAFNRYFHSHHRHAVVAMADNSLVLDHVSTDGEPPLPIESLFTCGLYIALLEEIGCRGLVCRFPGSSGTVGVAYRDGRALAPPLRACSRWDFQWAAFEPRRPLPGIDQLVLAHLPEDLTRQDSLAARIQTVLTADLARKWRIPDVARRLAVSPRSLQRHLREEGTSFSRLLTEARLGGAKRMLRQTAQPITTIGYVCGFADTAHFTRTFKAATTLAPTAWRAAQTSEAAPFHHDAP